MDEKGCRVFCLDIDEIYRALPLGMDNMNPDIIRRRRYILEQYIQVFFFKRNSTNSSFFFSIENPFQ